MGGVFLKLQSLQDQSQCVCAAMNLTAVCVVALIVPRSTM